MQLFNRICSEGRAGKSLKEKENQVVRIEAHDICGPCSIEAPRWPAKIKQEMETEKRNSWLLSQT